MKIALLGGTGKVGDIFVEAAFAKNHRLNILVRDVSKIAPDLPNTIKIIKGDAHDKKSLAELIKGTDAVVSLLGHGKNTPRNLQAHAMKLLEGEMEKAKIKRLISLTGYGVPSAQDLLIPHHSVINFIVRLVDMDRYDDGVAHVEVLEKTQLDWTVVRTPVHKNWKSKIKTEVGSLDWNTGLFVDRKTIAKFILHCLEEKHFIKSKPIVSNWPIYDI